MSMATIGECMPVLEALKPKNYDEQKCLCCGAIVRFYNDEYRKPCNRCGTMVISKLEKARSVKKTINCWVCMDKGLVQYPVQTEGKIYYYLARCNCPKGMKYPGTIPLLAQCELAPREEFFELENRKTCAPDTVLG